MGNHVRTKKFLWYFHRVNKDCTTARQWLRLPQASGMGGQRLTASILVRAVSAIGLLIAKEFLGDALAIPAGEFFLGTNGLVGHQLRQGLPWLLQTIAIGHLRFPVARLPVYIEGEPIRTSDSGQTDLPSQSCSVASAKTSIRS